MTNTKSAEKSLKKSKNKRKYNISNRSMLRTFIKKVYAEIKNNSEKNAQAAFIVAQKILDRQSRKGLIHKNKSARYKSKMHLHIKSITSTIKK